MPGFNVLLLSTALLAPLALAPTGNAQISININVPPSCSYGYYGYAPYACAPSGYYGPGYFYNGIFLGMGPWANWGYGHGWGSHRFTHDGGGRYHGGGGGTAYRGPSGSASDGHASKQGESHAKPSPATHGGTSHAASHTTAAHGGTSHAASHTTASHSGGESHGNSGSHGGEDPMMVVGISSV
ncbi:MAG: hypothetical protein WA700_09030 [Acidobacteriaceae bacterium]